MYNCNSRMDGKVHSATSCRAVLHGVYLMHVLYSARYSRIVFCVVHYMYTAAARPYKLRLVRRSKKKGRLT